MATDRERELRLRAERTAAFRRFVLIKRDTEKEVARLLELAMARIKGQLADQPTEFQAFQLPQIQRAVRQAMDELAAQGAAAANRGAAQAWDAGVAATDGPIEAGLSADGARVRLAAMLPEVDTRQLSAMRSFLTDKIKDVAVSTANRINSEIGLVAIGAQSPSEAVSAISRIAGIGRGRAFTILRTELGRAFSVAGQERQAQARQVLPGLRKQWRRSGKIHSRATHDVADGQVRDVDEPFLVGGEKLMYPRDPRASAKNTVNCGCTSLPWMESWEVKQPGRQAFTSEELANDPRKRDLDAALS